MIFQKARVPKLTPATEEVFGKIGVGDNLWLEVKAPVPVKTKSFYTTEDGRLKEYGPRVTDMCYRSNIRLRYADRSDAEEWAMILAKEVELVNEFLDTDKQELPVFLMEVYG